MSELKFKITKEIFEKFPELNIGLVIARGIDNTGEEKEVMDLILEQETEIKSKYNLETLPENPTIDAWRNAYSSFGAKPKKYKSSVENLYRMILEDIQLRHINKIVDIYNYVSIKNMIPVGGDDIDKIDGNITLKIATGEEKFVQLNSDEIQNPKPGEVVYADDKEVLCRRWNWRECDKSKMTTNTKNVALVVEGLPPTTKDEVEKVISELSSLVKKYCRGEISTYILNSDNPQERI